MARTEPDAAARRTPWLRRACANLMLISSLGAAGAAAQSVDLAAAVRNADPNALCADTRVLGQCFCAGVVCGVRVRRYVPVAFIETTVAPGDTLLGAAGLHPPRIAGTISSALSTTDNTAEAHVWRLSGTLAALASGMPCLACAVASATLPISGAADAACGPASSTSQAMQATAGSISAAVPLPVLSYASELDWLNWRTGCRDLFVAAALGAVAGPTCTHAGASGGVQEGAQRAADTPATGTDDACIGAWGPLRPRQMRDVGPTPVLYSAKTAVRAMSIAREQLGSFPFPVDTQGKLQQVYPVISACFGVGELPLPSLPDSPRPVATSVDGRYGWIYWRPATCCAGLAGAAQCLRGMLPRP